MTKILFIGNFLSKYSGTKGAIEKLASHFPQVKIEPILISSVQNKYLRLTHMLFASLFFRYKIIHIDLYSGAAFKYAELCSKLAKLRNKTIVVNLRGGMLVEIYQVNPARINSLFASANHIITPSLFLQTFFKKKEFTVDYIPNGIDFSSFPFKRENIEPHSLLWVRAFNNIYSPEVAVLTLEKLVEKYPDVNLTMIGPDKGKLPEIEALIAKYNLSDSINIIGAIPNNQLFEYYQTKSVFLNTTQYESFGVCLAEAASCGIPFVSNRVGEIPYLWESGSNCFLIENNSVDQFAEHISMLFDQPEIGSQFSKTAKQQVEQFEASTIINKWGDLLKRIEPRKD